MGIWMDITFTLYSMVIGLIQYHPIPKPKFLRISCNMFFHVLPCFTHRTSVVLVHLTMSWNMSCNFTGNLARTLRRPKHWKEMKDWPWTQTQPETSSELNPKQLAVAVLVRYLRNWWCLVYGINLNVTMVSHINPTFGRAQKRLNSKTKDFNQFFDFLPLGTTPSQPPDHPMKRKFQVYLSATGRLHKGRGRGYWIRATPQRLVNVFPRCSKPGGLDFLKLKA